MSLAVSSFSKGSRDWQAQTTERYRIDEHVIDQLTTNPDSVATTEACKTLLTRCNYWIKNTLFNPKSDAPLRITKHLLERANDYNGKLSRCKTFIELHENERKLIESLPNILCKSSVYKIVEIGLNAQGNICKIALLFPFNQWIAEEKERKLFLLVGCDGGLKTFYVVPNQKWRKTYQKDDSITSLSLELLNALNAKHLAPVQRQEKDSEGWTVVKRKK